jgi:hypothetical protein
VRIKLGRLAFAILIPLLAIALFLITGSPAVVIRDVPNQAFADADCHRDSDRHQDSYADHDPDAQAHGATDSYTDCYWKLDFQQDTYRDPDQEGTSVALPRRLS